MQRPTRVLYATGPGDLIGTLLQWSQGLDDTSQVAVTYSGQFFDACIKHGLVAKIITPNRTPRMVRKGMITVQYIADPRFQARGGMLFHLGRILYSLHVVYQALRFRANVLLGGQHGTHLFMFALLALFRVKWVPSFHCTLWPPFSRRRPLQQFIHWLDGHALRRTCYAVLSISWEINQQIGLLTGDASPPILSFLPHYRKDVLLGIAPRSFVDRPFKVLYVGRLEQAKGVFDLLEVARKLREDGHEHIVFDLCGDGSAQEQLIQAAGQLGLASAFRFHGQVGRAPMEQFYEQSHVVIVPTTAQFPEGFNKVVIEAALAGRPVITSAACPSLADVKDAAIEVPVGSVAGYCEAILSLYRDQDLYERKCRACSIYQEQFRDPQRSFGAALSRLFDALLQGESAASIRWLPASPDGDT